MVTSGDITAIQQRGIKAGGVLTETISDNLGGGYVIQGYLPYIYSHAHFFKKILKIKYLLIILGQKEYLCIYSTHKQKPMIKPRYF